MKRVILPFVLLAFAVSFNQAQSNKDISMKPILYDVLPIIDELEEHSEIVRMEFDIITGEKTAKRNLASVWRYSITAIGDYRVEEIELEVGKMENGKYKSLGITNFNSKAATFEVQPDVSDEYIFTIRVPNFVEGYTAAHYCLLVYHDKP